VACSELLEQPTRGPVCGACWRSIPPLTPPICDVCGDPLPDWRIRDLSSARCVRCRRGRRHVDRARALGVYDGTLRSIIHALKYDARRSIARRLAALMQTECAELLVDADAVVPVPLHHSRRRERGFNQAADLARDLGRPVVFGLRRVRATATQADLPASRRHSNVRGAFAPTPCARTLSGRTVVLVDDVSTTGATLDACAAALKACGVREVRALTAARVVTKPR
jgi:ComF family protein